MVHLLLYTPHYYGYITLIDTTLCLLVCHSVVGVPFSSLYCLWIFSHHLFLIKKWNCIANNGNCLNLCARSEFCFEMFPQQRLSSHIPLCSLILAVTLFCLTFSFSVLHLLAVKPVSSFFSDRFQLIFPSLTLACLFCLAHLHTPPPPSEASK